MGKQKNECNDEKCPLHGTLSARGRIFQGIVRKVQEKRVVVDFDRITYIPKYERYMKKKTRLHAYVPMCMSDKIKIGDLVKISECRPLSKLIHFVVIENRGESKK
ncbi:MAG: 30S ribosomal protein S17 [Candidatus Pacearchaeota archaeon]